MANYLYDSLNYEQHIKSHINISAEQPSLRKYLLHSHHLGYGIIEQFPAADFFHLVWYMVGSRL